jgi:hypothetical protein
MCVVRSPFVASLLHQRLSSPRKRGTSTPRLIDSITGVSEYWVARFRGRRRLESVERHCEPTGRANARPMTGSAKQSILSFCCCMDCFVASLLAMTANTDTRSRSRGAIRPRFAKNFRPENRGRGECRAPDAPAASCAHIGSKYAHEYSQRATGKHPTFPHAMVYGLYRALPGDRLSCHRRYAD